MTLLVPWTRTRRHPAKTGQDLIAEHNTDYSYMYNHVHVDLPVLQQAVDLHAVHTITPWMV